MSNPPAESNLVSASQQGSVEALNELVLYYLPIIRSIAMDFKKRGLDTDDFIQEGVLAFIKAVETYDFNNTASFSTYASVCIKNRFNSLVKIRKMDFPEDVLVSFDNSNEVLNIDDKISVEDKLIDKFAYRCIIEKADSVLSDFEKKVFDFYLEAYTYDEIACALNTSPKAVDNALQRIRSKLKKTN